VVHENGSAQLLVRQTYVQTLGLSAANQMGAMFIMGANNPLERLIKIRQWGRTAATTYKGLCLKSPARTGSHLGVGMAVPLPGHHSPYVPLGRPAVENGAGKPARALSYCAPASSSNR
jgi:hypothetical protein